MSNLVGIWSDKSQESARQFAHQHGGKMISLLNDNRVQPFMLDTLWLATAQQNFVRHNDSCAAMIGYLPIGFNRSRVLESLATDQIHKEYLPDGFYNLVHFNHQKATLTLLRSHSGGERFYYLRIDDILVFSTSIRPLLTVLPVTRQCNRLKLPDIIYAGIPLFDDKTLIQGVNEVLPGHQYQFHDGQVKQTWCWPKLLQAPQGQPDDLAAKFRQTLLESLSSVIGSQRPVAVTLSGGIDSAAITALAAEIVGADNIVAYTYEFADSGHPVETPYAIEVCKKLGIKQHKIFKITLDQYLQAIPETIWRSEHFVHWSKAFMLPVAKRIREDGFSQFLSGFGIGSHMGFIQELSPHLNSPWLTSVAKIWRRGQSIHWLSKLENLHPIFAIPNRRLYYLLIYILHRSGRLSQNQFLPTLPELEAANQAFDPQSRSMVELIRYHCFTHLLSCIDVTRWDKPMRELGIHRVSPAHFIDCLPYAYLPLQSKPFVWSKNRQLRPGKQLLRLALKNDLPDSVLYRKKSWADAVVSPKWLSAGIRWMRQAIPNPPITGVNITPESLAKWDQYSPQASLTAFAFWHRLFIDLEPTGDIPDWQSLTNTTPIATGYN